MTVRVKVRCTCETPSPVGPYVVGVRKCAVCGKVANWMDFESDVVNRKNK